MAWQGKGSNRAWRRKRAYILNRDHHRCQLQYEGICLGRANSVHHLEPWQSNPADIPTNKLIAACMPCNQHAGQPTNNPDPEPKPWNP